VTYTCPFPCSIDDYGKLPHLSSAS
jgi:hypothetical protein